MKAVLSWATFLVLSSSVYAVATLYPGNTDGTSAVDLKSQSPVYYPPAQIDPLKHPQQGQHSQNIQPQPNQQYPGTSPTNPQLKPPTQPSTSAQ